MAKRKIIALSGHIGFEVTAQFVRGELNAANDKDVEVQISSPGGFVSVGLEIINLIREHKGEVTTKIMGQAASMAAFIALVGDKVIAHSNTVFMVHFASGFSFGTHKEMRKTADVLENLSLLLAKELVRKTGKTLEEAIKMLDNETFLFGDEMLNEGIVDEIIEPPETDKNKNDDKSSAITKTRMAVDNCFDIMRKSEESKFEFEKVAAHLKLETENKFEPASGSLENKNNNTGKVPEKKNKEANNMTLKELLEQNPAAKIEYDHAVAQAKAEGEKAGKDSTQAVINKVTPIVESEVYPTAIKALAAKVLKGESEFASLEAVVTMHDAQLEKEKGKKAGEETDENGETPPDGSKQNTTEDGSINTTEDYAAEQARLKDENVT